MTFLEKLLFILASKLEIQFWRRMKRYVEYLLLRLPTARRLHAIIPEQRGQIFLANREPKTKKRVLKTTVYGGWPKVSVRKLFRGYHMPQLDNITLPHTLQDEIKILMCLYHII